MKRKPRTPGRSPSLRVERDGATGRVADAARPRSWRYSALKLPHERDESAHRPGPPGPITEQGAQDLEGGKVDTDCYGATGERFDRRNRRTARG